MGRLNIAYETRVSVDSRVQTFLRKLLGCNNRTIMINLSPGNTAVTATESLRSMHMFHPLYCKKYNSNEWHLTRVPNTHYAVRYSYCDNCHNCCYIIIDM